ncbi:MAG: hypothetical protein HKN76_18675 [Saprospiraceae bacterium]|nr:hypothetical protein [Saprospiraceae bacterium]
MINVVTQLPIGPGTTTGETSHKKGVANGICNKLGLSIKYKILGFMGGLIALILLPGIGYEPSNPIATVIGCTIGGWLGGFAREKIGKSG